MDKYDYVNLMEYKEKIDTGDYLLIRKCDGNWDIYVDKDLRTTYYYPTKKEMYKVCAGQFGSVEYFVNNFNYHQYSLDTLTDLGKELINKFKK